MSEFATQRKAKEFLVDRIVAEAEREGKPLSEIEQKMLYFSETDWVPSGMLEVNDEFKRTCDTDEYERKIAALIRQIEAQNKSEDGEKQATWNAAIYKLSEGDHYLLIMLNPRFAPAGKSTRPSGDLLRLWLTAFGIVFGGFGLMAAGNWLFGQKFWDMLDWFFGHH